MRNRFATHDGAPVIVTERLPATAQSGDRNGVEYHRSQGLRR
eukprot:gene30508-52652_t